MTAKELATINNYKKDFEEKFGKKLMIDFSSMNGLNDFNKPVQDRIDCEQWLYKRAKQLNIDLEVIKQKNKHIHKHSNPKEWQFLQEFAKKAMTEGWSLKFCSSLINKDRTIFYHRNKISTKWQGKKHVKLS